MRYLSVQKVLHPSVPVSAENMRYVSVSRKRGKLDPSRHGVMEVDEIVNCDESSESTGVRSRVMHAWLFQLMRLSQARELHRRAVEVPPRLLR